MRPGFEPVELCFEPVESAVEPGFKPIESGMHVRPQPGERNDESGE